MKILYLTTEGFDTPGPDNPMTLALIDSFLNEGFEVHLIQSRRKKINPDIPLILKDRCGFSYDIIDRKVIDKTNFVTRYFEEMFYAFKCFGKWRKVEKIDAVFVQSCPTVIYQLGLLRIFSRKPVIYNIYDVFPGHAYDIGVIKSKLLYSILNYFQKPSYKMSSVITVMSKDMKKIIAEQNVHESKIHIIPAWYDESLIKEVHINDNKFIRKYNIDPKKFYVQFAGTIGYVFNYKAILEAAEYLKSEEDIVFQIVGDGNAKKQFIEEVKRRNLDNIEFYPLQPLEIVPDVYSTCTICVIPLKKGVIGNGVPSKAPILMACRRVIVNSVEPDSDYHHMFNTNEIGISVSNNDHKQLADAILKLYNNPDLINVMANKAQTFAKKNYTSKVNTQKFVKLIIELTDQ